MKTCKVLSFIFFLIFSHNLFAQEKQVELFIEYLSQNEAYDIKGGIECHPGDIIITIKSDVSGLKFDSNVMDITSVTYIAERGEYIFCHSKESFWLTIGSDKHISKKTYIDGLSLKYALKIVEKASTGKVYFKTFPNNALVDFGFSGQSPQLTGIPIEMNSGEYNVKISKHGYLSVDTFVVVPSEGNMKQIDIVLKPAFAKILLDITSVDNSQFQILPVVDIDTSHVNLADLSNPGKIKSFDDASNLEYFKLYSGGAVPVPQGSYRIIVNAPGFKTFNTRIVTIRGGTTPLIVKMQPITGFLTIIDNGNAMGAKVFLDDELIGNAPLYRYKTRIGSHKLRFEKEGFITQDKEYEIISQDGKDQDFSVTMTIFKQYRYVSNPAGAEILVDGQRQGFTPRTISLNEGAHEVILRKLNYLDHKMKQIIDETRTLAIDTIEIKMEKNYPIKIISEKKDLLVVVYRNELVVADNCVTPVELKIPYGKYKLQLFDGKRKCFSGSFVHDGKKSVNAPCISKGTFTTLVGDYHFQTPTTSQINSDEKQIYNLFATAHFGRFNVFPGLSTSILRTSVFQINDENKGASIEVNDKNKEEVQVINSENVKYSNFMFGASCMFLNGELRLGGSILKNIDIEAVGSFVYYPDILSKFIALNNVNGNEIFYGIELTSRISTLNVNVKFGKRKFSGDYNYLLKDTNGTTTHGYSAFSLDNLGLTVGFTLGGHVSKGNNMIRLWKKPLKASY